MAVTAGVGIGAGVAAAAGATAAAIRAAKQKAQPTRSFYGGSDNAEVDKRYRAYLQSIDNEKNVNAARDMQTAAIDSSRAQDINGQRIAATAQQDQGVSATGNRAASMITAFQPGAYSQAMSRQVLDQNAQANLGAARSGGALGLRTALNANAQAGVASAAQSAAQVAQERQQMVQMQVAQENADRATRIEAEEAQRQRVLQQQQLGLNYANSGNSMAGQLSLGYGAQAQQRELGQAQIAADAENQMLQAQMDYDQRRQAEAQRRSDRLWGFAGNLLGVAGNAFGSAGGK